MTDAMRSIFKTIVRFLLLVFFDRAYIKGHYFDQSLGGYVWGLRAIWARNILRLGPPHPWPVDHRCTVSNSKNICFDPNDLNNFQVPGTYYQCNDAQIHLGKGSYIAPNVGIITANHDLQNPDLHVAGKDVVIGEKSWIGMNSVILPGVILGPHSVVAAGSVVTRSFPQGYVVLAGTPARILKNKVMPI